MPYPDERSVLTEIDVQHAGIGPFHQHSLPVSQSEHKKSALGKERTGLESRKNRKETLNHRFW
jgi:hypothetical protein